MSLWRDQVEAFIIIKEAMPLSPRARLSVIPTVGGLAMRFRQCDSLGREGSVWYKQILDNSNTCPSHDELKMMLLTEFLRCSNPKFKRV